jgi:hypothetical protein
LAFLRFAICVYLIVKTILDCEKYRLLFKGWKKNFNRDNKEAAAELRVNKD